MFTCVRALKDESARPQRKTRIIFHVFREFSRAHGATSRHARKHTRPRRVNTRARDDRMPCVPWWMNVRHGRCYATAASYRSPRDLDRISCDCHYEWTAAARATGRARARPRGTTATAALAVTGKRAPERTLRRRPPRARDRRTGCNSTRASRARCSVTARAVSIPAAPAGTRVSRGESARVLVSSDARCTFCRQTRRRPRKPSHFFFHLSPVVFCVRIWLLNGQVAPDGPA